MEAHLNRKLPAFSEREVAAIASELFAIEGELSRQNAERDLSYRIRSATGDSWVIKISNAAEPEGIVDMQIRALEHIAAQDSGLAVPRMLHTTEDKPFDWVETRTGTRHMVRVLTFAPGDVVGVTAAAHCGQTRFRTGAFMARLDLALRNYFHPHADSNPHLWDLGACLQLWPLIQYIENPELRGLCDTIFTRAEADTLPRLRRLRHQVIHQDAHAGNVLVAADDPTQIAGLIDFGDMLYGPIISELVVAADSYSRDDTDPLQNLCDVAAGFDSVLALEDDEIDLVYDLALIRLAMTVTIIHSRDGVDESDAHIVNDGGVDQVLQLMAAYGTETGIRRLRAACRFPVYTASNAPDQETVDRGDELLARREARLGKIWHFYDRPLNFTRGRGAWLFTADGTGYLDAYNNVPQFGHSNPHVVRAIARQAAALNTNTRYLCDIVADYAERLTAGLPPHLDVCIFVNSGSEANDVAMQLARYATGNRGAVIMENAYHGCTELTMQLSPLEIDVPETVACLEVPDMYRGRFAESPGAAEQYAADADRAIAELDARGTRPAAFMVDTALCSNGVVMAPPGYFARVAAKVRAAGGLVIADEVQAGMGRLGQQWGFMAQGLEPVDIITMGKPVGNAHPLGVVITNKALLDRFAAEVELFSTFGGNTVSCAAGMAVLDVIARDDLIKRSNATGDYLRAELARLADSHDIIGDIRGRGMLTGLELVSNRRDKTPATAETARLLELMRVNRVLVGSSGPHGNVLKLRPALVYQREDVDFLIAALNRCLPELNRG